MDSKIKDKPPPQFRILHEKAFDRFNIGTTCMETVASFIEDRTRVEEMISRRYKALADNLTSTLDHNSDFEYGAIRDLWCEIASQTLSRADTHAKVTVELARENGPMDTIQMYLLPSVQKRMIELVRVYTVTKQRQYLVLTAVEKAKVVYHSQCERYAKLEAELDAELTRRRRGGERCPRYLEGRRRVERQRQEVGRTRDEYLAALLEEEQSRPHYLQKMQEIKSEFDRLEKERLSQVRSAFLDILTALDSHTKREEVRLEMKTLREMLSAVDVHEEVEKFDDMYMEELPLIDFQDYTGQPVDGDDVSDDIREENDDQEPTTVNKQAGLVSASRRDQAVYKAVFAPADTQSTDQQVDTGECRDPPEGGEERGASTCRVVKRDLSDTCLQQKQTLCKKTNTRDHFPPSPREAFNLDERDEEDIKEPEVGEAPPPSAHMSNVKVRAISNYVGRTTSEISFKIGQCIKQKSVADATGMAYGWTRRRRGGKKRYGYFPVALVELKPAEPEKRWRYMKGKYRSD